MTDQTDDFGYGDVDDVQKQTSSGGKYLKLEYDKTVQVRVTDKPKYAIRHWNDIQKKFFPHNEPKCEFCGEGVKAPLKKDAQWYWVVIDREDERVKILQGPNGVARALKDLSELRDKTKTLVWGNPITFDVMITRYKKDNGFTDYKVEPLPNTKRPMNDEEVKKIKEAAIDLAKEVEKSKTSEHMGNYGGSPSMETAPADERVNPEDIPANLGETGGENIGPDDIPF